MKKIESNTQDILREKEFVRLVQTGSAKQKQEAFDKLYARHKEAVMYRILRAFSNDKELARDLTQEVFIRVHTKIHTYEPKGAFSTWLYKITDNLIIDTKRQSKHEVLSFESLGVNIGHDSEDSSVSKQIFQLEDKSADSYGLMIREERAEVLGKAINSIKNEKAKRALLSFFMEEKSHKELCNEMKLPLGTVKALIFRAKESIKNYLSQEAVDFKY